MESCKTEIEKILYQSFPILARHPILIVGGTIIQMLKNEATLKYDNLKP